MSDNESKIKPLIISNDKILLSGSDALQNLTVSSSSWTFVANDNNEEEEMFSDNIRESKITQDEEESDGISVISGVSESSEIKNETISKIQEPKKCDDKLISRDLVPIKQQDEPGKSFSDIESNNSIATTDEEENVQRFSTKDFKHNRNFASKSQNAEFSCYLLLGAFMIVILGIAAALTVSSINSLKVDVELLRSKVYVLEEERQNSQLKCDSTVGGISSMKKDPAETSFYRPKTKTVYNGESEESIQILDKENQIPDFCYFIDDSDLFADYNKEKCDRLFLELKNNDLKSLDKSKHKKHKKQNSNSKDDEWKKEYIHKTIDSIKRDIESKKIKKDYSSQHKKNSSDKPEKPPGKKKNFKNKQDDNWMDQRSKQREQLRNTNI